MTHDDLIQLGSNWLKHDCMCGVRLHDFDGKIAERPDVMGWTEPDCISIVIECKVSRRDFLRDFEKLCRHRNPGVGERRYYLFAKPDIMKEHDDIGGWGVLVPDHSHVRTLRPSSHYEADYSLHERILLRALRQTNLSQALQHAGTLKQMDRILHPTKDKANKELAEWDVAVQDAIGELPGMAAKGIVRMVGIGPWKDHRAAARMLRQRAGRYIQCVVDESEVPVKYFPV